MKLIDQFVNYDGEDEPRFKTCMILPYWYDQQKKKISYYLRRNLVDSNIENIIFGSAIHEREPSIFFTVARTLIMQSCSFFPSQEIEYVTEPRSDIHLYYNPLINIILEKLEYSDQCIFDFADSCFQVWYPLDYQIEQIQEINKDLIPHGIELVQYTIDLTNNKKADPYPEIASDFIEKTLQTLQYRNLPEFPIRKPKAAIIILDDAHDWRLLYESLFMPQLMLNPNDKWKHYKAYMDELPSEEDLKTINFIVLTGSGRSVYEKNIPWVEPVKELIIRIFNDMPHIKMLGGCFGCQLIAYTLGGDVNKMPNNPKRPKVLGREHIIPTNDFFDLKFVKKYMNEHGYTKETFPNIVLQQSHGDHVVRLPETGTLLASSESCHTEIYCIDNRALAFQSHPDFNCGFQQELSEPEYFQAGIISAEFHTISWLNCSNTEYGPESRNMILSLIREFLSS